MALKLKWRTKHLQIDFHREIEKIRTSDSSHVQPVGNDVLVENFFGMKNKVPDVSRYRICKNGNIIPHFDQSGQIRDISGQELKRRLQQQSQIRNIVLLLESPHKDEYERDITCPKAPACGSTGRNIKRHLHEVLSHIENQKLIVPSCHVVISNPVPFQTSLHAIHGNSLKDKDGCRWATLRDYVWLTLWDEKRIRSWFQARLKRYNPSLIVNACTSHQKSSVNDFVRGKLPTMTLYNVGHPASWNSPKNRVPKRIYP